MDEDQKNLPLPEKELPAPHDMLLNPAPPNAGLLPKPTFWEKHAPSLHPILMVLIFSFLVADIAYFSFLALQGKKTETPPPQQQTPIVALSPTPTSEPADQAVDTSNWETYKSTDGIVSFQYPPSLTLRNFEWVFNQTPVMHFSSVNNEDNLSLEQLDKKYTKTTPEFGTTSPNLNSLENKQIIIGGVTAYHQEKAFCEPTFCQRYIIQYGNKVYVLTYFSFHKNLLTKTDVDAILSTFTFLNQIPTVTSTSRNDDKIVCTMEAEVCPDGTSVGRTGPNCEFATCP